MLLAASTWLEVFLSCIAIVLEVAHVHHDSGLMLRKYFSAPVDDLPKDRNFCSASAAFAAPWMSQTWLSWKLLTTLLSWRTLLMMCFEQNLAWCLWDSLHPVGQLLMWPW